MRNTADLWIASLGCSTLCLAAPVHAQAPTAPSQTTTAGQVQGVTVVAARAQVATSIESRSFSIDKDLNAANGSIADALRNLPSMTVDMEGNITLRGEESVQILVDGKPSTMFSGPARGQALLAFPAKNIARVELNTAPSAAYSAEGVGGIINLVTARPSAHAGGNGSLSGQVSNFGDTRISATYALPLGRATLTGSASTARNLVKIEADGTRTALFAGAAAPLQTAWSTDSRRRAQQDLGSLKLDYSATSKDQLTGDLTLARFKVGGDDALAQRGSTDGRMVSAFAASGSPLVKVAFWSAAANWTHTFDEPEHDLVVALSSGRNGLFNLIDRDLAHTYPAQDRTAERNLLSQVIRQSDYSLTYRRPLSDGAKLRLGVQRTTDDDAFDALLARGPTRHALVTDDLLSSQFGFEQAIDAAFAIYERPAGKLTTQLGLRLEAVNMTIQAPPTARIKRGLTGAYPSLNAVYQLDEHDSLRLGVSRRVQRPIAARLNPFRAQLSPLSFQQGNPYLAPQETTVFELGIQRRDGQTFRAATAYWRDANGEITPVTEDLGDGAVLVRPANLVSSRTGGLEFVANGRLSAGLSYRTSANLSWKQIDAAAAGGILARQATGLSGNATLDWSLTAADTLQINGILVGRALNAQGRQETYATMNLGWRRRIGDHVTATLSIRDAFNTLRTRQSIKTDQLSASAITKQMTRAIVFQITRTLGGPRIEGAFDYSVPQAPGS